MFNLDETQIPKYQVQHNGTVHEFDAVEAMAKLARLTQGLEAETVPFEKLPELVKEVFELELETSQAALLLQDFREFTEKEVQGPLEGLIGSMPSLDTTTESQEPNLNQPVQGNWQG